MNLIEALKTRQPFRSQSSETHRDWTDPGPELFFSILDVLLTDWEVYERREVKKK